MCNQEQTTAARMEALFKRFYRPLYLYALTFLRDEDQAKDITGGVFQTVWEMLREGSLAPDTRQTVGFLYTTVRRRCLDKLRHDQVMDRYTHLQEATAPLDTEEEVMDFERRIEQVKDVIELLPEPEKSILKCTLQEDDLQGDCGAVAHLGEHDSQADEQGFPDDAGKVKKRI